MTQKRSISIRIEVPTDTLHKKLEELVDEVIEPLRLTLTDADITKLKQLFGDDVTLVSVGSLHVDNEAGKVTGPPIVMTGPGGGYAARQWSKATAQ